MMMLTKVREAKGWTRFKLGSEARIHPARTGQIENRRAVPYDVELARIAAALGYTADPATLLEEVGDGGRD